PDRIAVVRRLPGLLSNLFAALGVASILCSQVSAQSGATAVLRLGKVAPGGVRTSATESWGAFECEITNTTDEDRFARAALLFPKERDVQFGRDLWVPARSTITTWLLAGPPGLSSEAVSCELLALVAEPSGND